MLSIHKLLIQAFLLSATIVCCQLGTLVHAQADGPTLGTQKSESGIRHSFLVTGSITAIIGEDNRVQWQVPGRSRDGFVLPNGNVLISIDNSAREYTRAGELVFQYKLDPVNKELGTVVRLENGNTMVVERGVKPRILEITCLLYTSPSPRDRTRSRMPSSA